MFVFSSDLFSFVLSLGTMSSSFSIWFCSLFAGKSGGRPLLSKRAKSSFITSKTITWPSRNEYLTQLTSASDNEHIWPICNRPSNHCLKEQSKTCEHRLLWCSLFVQFHLQILHTAIRIHRVYIKKIQLIVGSHSNARKSKHHKFRLGFLKMKYQYFTRDINRLRTYVQWWKK